MNSSFLRIPACGTLIYAKATQEQGLHNLHAKISQCTLHAIVIVGVVERLKQIELIDFMVS